MRRRIRSAALPLHRHSLPQLAVDGALVALAYYLAFQLRFDSGLRPAYQRLFDRTWPWVVLGTLVILTLFRLYKRWWRYAGQRDYEAILRATVVSTVATVVAVAVLHPVQRRAGVGTAAVGLPNGVIALYALMMLAFLTGARFLAHAVHERPLRGLRVPKDARDVLIVGAGDGGRLVLREVTRNRELALNPVGFIDDDPTKQGLRLDGVRVLGATAELSRILDEVEPDEVIIAIPSAPGTVRALVVRACRERGIPVRTLPTVFELLRGGPDYVRQVREVQVEDVLGREPVRMELDRVGAYLAGQVVLVTGAGGSIGAELCRQIARVAPRRLILLDHAEDNLFSHPARARGRPPRPSLHAGRRARRLQGGGAHARGLRRAPAGDRLPRRRLQARRADGDQPGRGGAQQRPRDPRGGDGRRPAGGQAFVLVSTDKAVTPATVMGASKALAEFALEAAQARFAATRYSAVRFGNVLGSSGSVVPIFRRQIANGGPVTVTDERMTRYFMTIPEAVQLVIRAGSLGEGGEIFVLEMGEPVPIVQLARDMIELSGLRPDRDIAIEIVGRRPGEAARGAVQPLRAPPAHPGREDPDRRARADGRRDGGADVLRDRPAGARGRTRRARR